MRGQQIRTARHGQTLRIIPARAGPTATPATSSHCAADHPRSCGANLPSCEGFQNGFGSSPLVRGQPIDLTLKTPHPRIIPARAGPTSGNGWAWCLTSDHPRSCGANTDNRFSTRPACGSSPLVRGQPLINRIGGTMVRIIPARAGPTFCLFRSSLSLADHPRSCGANHPIDAGLSVKPGSSPLVRGQLIKGDGTHFGIRIIPARAGPTTRSCRRSRAWPDHPRSCGANSPNSRTRST